MTEMATNIVKLPTNQIEATAKTQVRVKIDQQTVDEYAEAMDSGAEFPPIVVFAEDGSHRYILADGGHRLRAADQLGWENVEVDLRNGGLWDALRFALGANAEHGLKRTNADKHCAVKIALNTPEFDDLSNRQFAELCRVSHTFVNQIRADEEIPDDHGNVSKDRLNSAEDPSDYIRPTRSAPSQSEFDRASLMDGLKIIKSFPYDGAEAAKRLDLDGYVDDIAYCCDWLRSAVKALRATASLSG